MTIVQQILFGTTLLAICCFVHVAALSASLPFFPRIQEHFGRRSAALRICIVLTFAVVTIVVAHTVQIWTWAALFLAVGIFQTFNESFYFAIVTYTTVGYGDVTLGPGLRIFGTFASITGLLTFGISTAVLVGVVTRLMPSLSHDDAQQRDRDKG